MRNVLLEPVSDRTALFLVRSLAFLAAGVFWFGDQPSAKAQVVAIEATGSAPSDGADPKLPFTLPSQSSEATEALEDFGIQSKRGSWDRAFKALEKLQQANPNGMVGAPDGFLVSVRTRIWQALASLPPAGKDAYRVFYDAEAKKLLAEAEGQTEVEKLTKVFTWYFPTSTGDVAADRLGDLYFEQGDLVRAAECWQAVLEHRPDSALPPVRLLVKAGIALARAGRWQEFRQIERTVRERYAGEVVTLGGREVEAAKHLASLAPPPDGAAPVQATTLPEDIVLGPGPEPLWQFRYFPQTVATAIARARQDWGPPSPLLQFVPPSAVDESRVYLNLLGHHLALDLATGKLLWRSEKYHDIAQKAQGQPYMRPEQYAVAAASGKVYFVSRAAKQLAQHGAHFHLICVNGSDGKQSWSSESVAELKEWSFSGTPLVTPDRLYVCGSKSNKATELHALAINPQNGKLLWSAMIGTSKIDPNQYYYQRSSQPALALHDGKLHVETHSGALVTLSAETGSLIWAFVYESDMPDTQRGWNPYQMSGGLTTQGTPMVVGGVLYSKGMSSPRLYAIQLSGPKLLWQRPVSKPAKAVAVDGNRLIMTGDAVESSPLDEKQPIHWSFQLPSGVPGETRPVITRNRIYQFTPRGIYELDKATGDPTHPVPFRGADLASLGGVLVVTPNSLVSVSNTAVTSYPIQRPETSTAASARTGPDQKE
ncbi:MAG: PQQ-binding-like beta-propeller repeat protein [Planctomycetes bacterium]|nr:PQQ-binding-like beta-propeller repeat protein [Planctomycetota bacterium]